MTAAASRPLAVAALAAAVALIVALVWVRTTHPPGVFLKYPAAAEWSPEERAARAADLSPLYLALNRALVPSLGHRAVLYAQAGLHAATAAAVALAVCVVVGWRWGLVAGVVTATYRPFLVHAGIHEPETVILFVLALAVAAGSYARSRLARGAVPWAAAIVAGTALAAATALRPQHLLLVPVWAVWLASGGGRRGRVAALACLTAAAAALAPLVVTRAGGELALMNPGPVFYEGNGPGATGLTRSAPRLVQAIERDGSGLDYAHVAYRHLAAHALGRAPGEVSVAEANAVWRDLAFESIRADPGAAVRRCMRKLLYALMPREAHDVQVTEDLDRRVRALLPWGFAVPLMTLPWLLLVRRERLASLTGPLAVAGLSIVTQVVFYASARQRLPLALALIVTGAVAASELAAGRLRGVRRPALAVGLGIAGALFVAYQSASAAIGDEVTWDDIIGPARPSLGESLARLHDGRALRAGREYDHRMFVAAVDLLADPFGHQAAVDALEVLGGQDFTADDRLTGVPEYWLARHYAQRRERERARELATVAHARRPDDTEVAALAAVLSDDSSAVPGAGWRPAGVDPASATWALSTAALAAGDTSRAAAYRAELAPFFAAIGP